MIQGILPHMWSANLLKNFPQLIMSIFFVLNIFSVHFVRPKSVWLPYIAYAVIHQL